MNAKSKSSRSWAARLVGEIVDGGSFSALAPEHMDRLLAWLAGREGPSSDLITAEFSARALDETESKRLVLSALDDRLFGDDLSDPLSVLGLDGESDPETIKARYRRLMQVYHPDRAVVHGDWLTSRAETINQAYSRLNKNVHNRNGRSRPYENGVRPAAQAKPSYGARAGKGVYPAPQDKFHLRKSLGSAQKFQREVLITLVVVSVLLLGLIYISSRDTGIPPREETPTVDIGVKRNRLPAAVEQPEPDVEKAAEVHVEGGAEDSAIEVRGDPRPAGQKSAGLESATAPERKEGRVESADAGKETEQGGAIDPEQSVTAAHAEIEKRTELVKDKSVSSSVEPATVPESQKQTAPGGIDSRGYPPEIQDSGFAGKRKIEPEQTRPEIKEIERKKVIASVPPAVRHVPELPEEPVISNSRRSNPEERGSAAKDSGQVGTLTDSTGAALRQKNQRKKAIQAVPSEKAVGEPVVRAVEVSKAEMRPDYQRKPTTIERFVAKRALVRYVDGIVEGDIDKVSYAVGQQIIVDGIPKSRGRLVTEYHTLFRNTSRRKYDFRIKSWRYIGNGTVRIEGEADIRYEYHSSPPKVYKGKLTYYLMKKGLDAKLVRIVQE